MNLNGKVAVVTGATRGIGNKIAEVLLSKGAEVFITGHSDEGRLHSALESLSKLGKVHGHLGKSSDQEFNKKLYKDVFDKCRRLDILVNNAGILQDSLIGMVTPDMVKNVFEVNVYGVIYNMQLASRLMQRNKSGSIVNLSSIIGTNGNEGQVVYGASKAAVIGATKSAAKELAPYNIRVNAVAPGFINTDMIKGLPEDKYAERMNSIKMKRIGEPTDIANTVAFLSADESAYVTGQVIGVDGGMLI